MPIGYPFLAGGGGSVFGDLEAYAISNFPAFKASTDNRTVLTNVGTVIGSKVSASNEFAIIIDTGGGANQAFFFNIATGEFVSPKSPTAGTINYALQFPVQTLNNSYIYPTSQLTNHRLIRIAPDRSSNLISAIDGAGAPQISRVHYAPESDTLLWFYRDSSAPQCNIMRSVDGGASWVYSNWAINNIGTPSFPNILWEASGVLFCAETTSHPTPGVLKNSVDGGLTWFNLGPTPGLTQITESVYIPEVNRVVVLQNGAAPQIVYSDSGNFNVWNAATLPLVVANIPTGIAIGGLVYAREARKVIAFAGGSVPIISDDFGATWRMGTIIGLNNPFQPPATFTQGLCRLYATQNGRVVYIPSNAISPLVNIS